MLIPMLVSGDLHRQSGLQSISPPQGGKIVYGQVDGQTTEAGAMGAVLRSLHDHLGDRPHKGRRWRSQLVRLLLCCILAHDSRSLSVESFSAASSSNALVP